jgi:predicted nucleotidyltransferase
VDKKVFEAELSKIVTVSKEFHVDKIILFGSCLDNVESARDIDIAVSGIDPKKFFKYYGRISAEIDGEVDIVDLDDMRQHFYNKIINQGRIIYAR